MNAVPDHVQLTLDGLRGELAAVRARSEQIEYAIAALSLIYVGEEAPPASATTSAPMAQTLAVALEAEARGQAAQKKRSVTRETVLTALRQAPPIGFGADEIVAVMFPGVTRRARARLIQAVNNVLDTLVGQGVVVRDDRLYRLVVRES